MDLQYLNKNISTNVEFSYHKKERFFQNWHYHSEVELVYIVKGKGTLHAGDFTGTFQENDIVLLGQNLPHMFDNGISDGRERKNKAYVFHIHKKFLINILNDYPEFLYLKNILDLSTKGALFRHKDNKECLSLLKNLKEAPDSLAVIQLLQMLFRLSNYKSPKQLCKIKWEDIASGNEKRIHKVISYISENFNESLNLEDVANIAGMNKAAFCRHFKKRSGKSFVEFLNETRVNFARKLLLDASSNYRISEVCFKSGFNSLSYFNRTFKKYTGYGPSEYKLQKKQVLIN